MDSLDPVQEIDRNASCADELYRLLRSTELPLEAEEDVDEWRNAAYSIVSKYNVTVLSTPISLACNKLIMQLDNQGQQISIFEKLNTQIRRIIDRRKLDIAAMYLNSQKTVNKPPFRIEFSEMGNKVFIDDCLIIYDKEKNDNKDNHQWLPLLVAFINSNGCQLLETSIEEVAHTTRGDALNKCISKANKILLQNYRMYKKQGKHIHKVSITKERGSPIRRLRIEE